MLTTTEEVASFLFLDTYSLTKKAMQYRLIENAKNFTAFCFKLTFSNNRFVRGNCIC